MSDIVKDAHRWLQDSSRILPVGLASVIRDLVAALTTERQAREQVEQERDRLREALQWVASYYDTPLHHAGCPCWGDRVCPLHAAISTQDGQR